MTLPEEYSPPQDLLSGQVILVTGATGGLGGAAARMMARHGATVILHGRDVKKLERLYDEIEAAGSAQPAILPLDFLKATQTELDGFAQTIQQTFGRLDAIFHGASHFRTLTPMTLLNLDVWKDHTLVNLAVPMALTKACIPLLKRAEAASVLFVSETHAIHPKAYWGAFAAGKSALGVCTQIWQDEQTETSPIRFNTVIPGPVATTMRATSHPGESQSGLRQPEEFARHVLFLIGRDSQHVKGQVLQFDDGPPIA
jgi:NAD(P)-dependent dehydrogenase (short-subunit alcohol dehydrogenase family)